MQEIPFSLRRQLPSAPRGTRYIYVDDQLLLINVKTRVILDFINIQVPANHNTYNRRPAPRTVDRMPSYQEQHPTHQPPSQARAYEASQGKPFTEDEHPSSHGQDHRMNKGKPDMGDDHPSQHAKNDRDHGQQDRGKPLWGDDPSSSQGQNRKWGLSKPERRPNRPSPQAQAHQGGGPDKEKGRPMGQGNQDRKKGGPPEDHAKMDKGNRGGQQQGDRQGGPPKGHDRPSKGKGKPAMDSPMADDSGSHQMNAKGKPDKGKPKGKGKPAMDSPMADDSGSHQMNAKGKPDKGKPKGKGKPSMDSPMADDSGSHQMESRGKPDKGRHGRKGKQKDRDSARGPSGQKGGEQFQSDSTPEENIQISRVEKGRGKGKSKGSGNSSKKKRGESYQEPAPSMAPIEQESPNQPDHTQQENIQIAKVEKGRGKGNSKGPGKTNKMKRGKRKQQADMTAAITQQEPAPSMAPTQPAVTASLTPLVFDNNQRSIIQSYYQNSGGKKSGKGRGKKSRGSKRNKTSSVSRNDILTQPTEPLPRSLESQLSPTPRNTQRVVYNQQVLLIENGTNKVLDAINVNN